MKAKRQKFSDVNGRKHDLHVVRALGRGNGFGVLDVVTNTFVSGRQGMTRQEAQRELKSYEAKSLAV
jgi:hypothetical protein